MEELSILNIIIGWLRSLWHIPFPPKPHLHFEMQEIEHWHNVEDYQSGINVRMFIINRGKKPATIRKIRMTRMGPDHLEYLYTTRVNPIELGVGKDTRFIYTYFFKGDYLTHDEIEFDLEFTHTEGIEKIHCVSKKASWFERARGKKVLPEQYYQIRIIHDSGGQRSYLYEFNKSKELAKKIILQIEKDVPSFPFGGNPRVMPGRIADYKCFERASRFETSEESLRSQYPHGYDGDFGGNDVTLEITGN